MTSLRGGCRLGNCLFSILIVIFVCYVYEIDASSCIGTCEEKFYDIQIHCKVYDDNVTKFETEFDTRGNATMLCSFLVELLLCVGRVAPVCLDQMFTIKEPYFQSPYDCHFNDSAYSTIQKYRTCEHLTTTTTTVVTKSSPSTTFQVTQKPSKSSSSLPSRTYEASSPVTFQTSKPTNQHQKESNSSDKTDISRQTLVTCIALVVLSVACYS